MSEPALTDVDADILNHERKLRPKQQVFKNLILKGENATQAYQTAYPGVTYNTAMVNGHKLLRNAKIQKAVQKRIAKALANAQVSDDEILGAAARQARSSIADVLDENGNFDIEKARKTGAIDFVKKIKTTKRITEFEGGTAETVSTEFELLTNQDARKELANYMGIVKSAPSPADELVKMLEALNSVGFTLCPADPTDNSGVIDVEDVE